MVKFKVKSNPQGQYYFPKVIREEWGPVLELEPNLNTGIIYPEGTPTSVILRSLKTLQQHFKQREEVEKEKGGSEQ